MSLIMTTVVWKLETPDRAERDDDKAALRRSEEPNHRDVIGRVSSQLQLLPVREEFP